MPLALPGRDPATALRVLLIDDDPEDLEWLGDILSQTSMEVAWHTASGFEEALTAVKLGDHDAYLVDYRLGARSGLELIRESAALATGPMILLTGVGDDEVDARALAAGAADYLSKDELTPSNLQRSLRYSVETWRAHREATDRYKRYLSLFDGVPVGLFRMTPDARLVEVNATAIELLGYAKKADLVGHNAYELLARPDQTDLIVEDGTMTDLDVELRRSDGGTVWVNLSVREVHDELGDLTHYEGAIFDVSLRKDAESSVKTAEAETRTQEALNQSLLESVGVPIAILDRDARVVAWNPSWDEHVGTNSTPGDERDLVARMPEDAPPEAVAAAREGVGKVLSGDSDKVTIEYSVVRDSETRHWRMTAVPAMEENAIVAHWDVTDERLARSALEDTIQAKDEFLASISHELRSPLSVIVGLSDIVRTEDLPAVEIKEFHDLIADQAQEMALIVEDLLVAGRMESETLNIKPTLFDVATETNNVLKPWQNRPDVNIQVNFEPGTFSAHADTLRFRQIVRNLVSNAVRYGQPPVTIDGRQEQKHLVVEVSDHGTGVPSESVHLMFQPYAHFASLSAQPSAIGLGLHVSRGLARLMGGELTYGREGDRTVFTLSLPSVAA